MTRAQFWVHAWLLAAEILGDVVPDSAPGQILLWPSRESCRIHSHYERAYRRWVTGR